MVRARFGMIAASLLTTVAGPTVAQQQALSQADKAHITAVENGLLPAIVIKGKPLPATSLAERMRQTHVPGVSIAFFDNGQIVWAKGYGLAEIASGRPVTTDTLFEAGSVSKPIAAIAALRMVEAGKLKLDQDVNTRLSAWKVPDNAFTAQQKVTLRRLLSHGAGLTVHGFPGYARDQPLPNVEQILNGQPPANTHAVVVDTVPGTHWSYSGGGYVITQLLMSETARKPFPDVMRKEVFDRVGMTHSTYEQPLPQRLWSEAATGYRTDGQPIPGGWHVYPEMAPAGLWTTPSDLARAAIEIQKDQAAKSDRLLSQRMAREMLTRQIGDWGLGFRLSDGRFGHDGDDEGFKADLEAFTTGSGQGVAILTNGDNGIELIQEILRAVAKTYAWPAFQPEERTVVQVEPAVLARYAGRYQIPGVTPLIVSVKDGELFMAAPVLGPEPKPLLAQSKTQFFNLENGATLEFRDGPNGTPAKIEITSGFGRFEAERAP